MMAPIWAFLVVIFAFPGIGQTVKPNCPNNKIYQCVPAPYCPRDLGSTTAFRCLSTTEVCCEEQKVFFGVRYTGGKYVPGPYSQDR